MTCALPIKCCLCAPAKVWIRDKRGRFLYGRKVVQERKPSPYSVDGRMVSITGVYDKNGRSVSPHREFCPGCLERMGIKIPMETP